MTRPAAEGGRGPGAAVVWRILSPADLPAAMAASPAAAAFGPFAVEVCADAGDLRRRAAAGRFDAVLLRAADAGTAALLEALDPEAAVVVVVGGGPRSADAGEVLGWFARGAQEVLRESELAGTLLPQRLRGAIERQRREVVARRAYATDLTTGLPHQQQLVEHMSQLLALREREPAPMALLVLRVEGLETAEARLGAPAADALRRKLGVRLRSSLRASDVVASIGDDRFAVLLGSILSPADAPRVGEKLLRSLAETVRVGADAFELGAALGLAVYPQDGAEAGPLLQRAAGLAASASAHRGLRRVAAGQGEGDEEIVVRPSAANDD